ncbi:unnamed protein product [Paramecium sonneborni]|uniref:Uncharacterized protein n=1 Tax=Paramecium sonneborni TaxID=65129 RepID=A0A8S1RLS6_9CILI|nr:unnamed protein product [Paramecium sonneborni]
MFQIPCLPGHDNVDFFCVDENCKDNRCYCFNQCIKNDKQHNHDSKYLFKIDQLPNYLNDINKLFQQIIKDLDKKFEDLCYQLKQLKKHLSIAFEWKLDKLKCLKGNNIKIALNNLIRIKEYQNRLNMILNENVQLLSQTLKECIVDLQLKDMNVFQFYQLQDCNINEKEICNAINVNYDFSVIICAFKSFIKIYEFKPQSFQEIQKINMDDDVEQLTFINQTNKFIVFSLYDREGQIFSKVQDCWKCQQTIRPPVSLVILLFGIHYQRSLIMTNDGTIILFLSSNCSSNVMILIYKNHSYQEWKLLSFERLQMKSYIFNTDMNESENLIILSNKQSIQIIQKQNQVVRLDNIQVIQTSESNPYAKFIKDNQFISSEHSHLCIYKQNNNNQMFEKIKKVNLNFGMDLSDGIRILQFNKIKKFLLISINSVLHIIRICDNEDLKIEYCVEDSNKCGMISQNGIYLVTQNQEQKQITIRQLQE